MERRNPFIDRYVKRLPAGGGINPALRMLDVAGTYSSPYITFRVWSVHNDVKFRIYEQVSYRKLHQLDYYQAPNGVWIKSSAMPQLAFEDANDGELTVFLRGDCPSDNDITCEMEESDYCTPQLIVDALTHWGYWLKDQGVTP